MKKMEKQRINKKILKSNILYIFFSASTDKFNIRVEICIIWQKKHKILSQIKRFWPRDIRFIVMGFYSYMNFNYKIKKKKTKACGYIFNLPSN